jgi:hypothetical protein
VEDLLADFANNTVPSVVFVDGRENVNDEHPTADVQVGEAWTKRIYDAAVASKAWSSTVVLLTYDEAGGFFDHVPPPNTCLARPKDSKFFELGVRVPLIAISPWARRHYVSKQVHQHTSITRFIETVYGLPSLTARDANSDALLDMFDFKCPPTPVPAAPASGLGGCGGDVRITVDKTSYALNEPIQVTFAKAPGNPTDWVGVYLRDETPSSSNKIPSHIWSFLGAPAGPAVPDNQYFPHNAPGTGITDGTVVLKKGSENNNYWPLPAGSYTVHLFANNGYDSLAAVQIDVRP